MGFLARGAASGQLQAYSTVGAARSAEPARCLQAVPSPVAGSSSLTHKVCALCSGPVVAMVWEGKNVVATGRKIIGATNPLASEPGTIRGDFAIDVGRNIIHGSDSVESAKREISLWFKQEEIAEYTPTIKPWYVLAFIQDGLPDGWPEGTSVGGAGLHACKPVSTQAAAV